MADCGSKRSAEGDLPACPPTKKPRSSSKRASDKERNRTRVNLGLAFPRWRALRAAKRLQLDSELAFLLLDTFSRMRGDPATVNIGVTFPRWTALRVKLGLQSDADLACLLLDSYLQTKSENQPEKLTFERNSSTETCESVDCEYPFMSSPSEVERETPPASVQSSENETESGTKDSACQKLNSQCEWTTTNQSEIRDPHTTIRQDKDEEFSPSLSVGDGRYMVDLGSPSEFVIDEECILQLFKSCRECNRQCTVRKQVKGLKLLVYQTCCFCQSCCEWTNLSDDDEGDLQMNGKNAAHEQTNSATSPSSNTS